MLALSDGIYLQHFSLRETPFSITPDTRFFFAHESCQATLNTLIIAIRTGEGFTKVVGEVGTGKTLICRKLLDSLNEHYITAYIPNPYIEPATLLLAIADELGLSVRANINQHRLLKNLTEFLLQTSEKQKRAVVIVLDEAHVLPAETLEALRLLSNLETERRKLLQLVLFGQPELNNRLDQPSIRQLQQRITFSANLEPMTAPEMEYYIAHRLAVAGHYGPRLFSASAIRCIYKNSGGIPRLINILGHKAMLTAFGEGSRTVEAKHIQIAADDTESIKKGIKSMQGYSRPSAIRAMLTSAKTVFSRTLR